MRWAEAATSGGRTTRGGTPKVAPPAPSVADGEEVAKAAASGEIS